MTQLRQARTRVVAGIIVDLKRRPVAATVRWSPQVRTTTDVAGRFRLEGVPDREGTIFVIPERADLAPEIEEIGRRRPGDRRRPAARADRRGGRPRHPGTPRVGVRVFPTVGSVGLQLPSGPR